jgi:very-short-patch-repair endonuclease
MSAHRFNAARRSLLEARAGHMRFDPSASEQRLWRAIRGKRLGVSFRRQVPPGRFIADFYAPKARLVVEVDGGYHVARRKADARRDEALRRLGCRVLRLDAQLVLKDLPTALALVSDELAVSSTRG